MTQVPLARSIVFRLLFLTVAAAIFPALVISIATRSISSNTLKDSIVAQQTELGRRMAEQVNGEVHQAQLAVELVARSSLFSAGSRVDQYEALRNLITEVPDFQEAMFVDLSGMELMKVSQQAIIPPLTHRQEDVKHSFVGAPFFSGNRLPTILIGEPVRAYWNPTRTGAVMAKMSFSSLGQMMLQAQVGTHGQAFIVDERGTLLAHPMKRLVLAHTNWAELSVVHQWQAHPLEPTGLHEYVDSLGQTQIALAYPIPLLKSAVIVQQPKADVFAPLVRMRNQFILWSSLSVALFIVIAVAVGWRILLPLRKLEAAAEQIGRGDTNVKLNIQTGDELAALGLTFEKMAQSLAGLERMRRDLISMIVHDLKMPLSTILPSLDALLAGDMGRLLPDQQHFVHMARRSGQEMLMLIQNLLDVAKMEEGKLTLHKELFSPTSWVENVVTSFNPVARAGKKKLEFILAKEMKIAEGDVVLLSRVLGNLVSNALRHTYSSTGEVVVSVYPEGNQLAVQVRDNGEGIAEEDQERIFEKFVQAGKHTAVSSGTGLGLTFCKMVVEAHGGRISVYSTPREGSLFTFHIPLPLQESSSPVLAEAEQTAQN